jgi:hypothetical protein
MKGFFEPQEEDVNFLEEKYKVSRPSVFGLKENEVKKEEYPPKKTPCQCQIDNSQDAIFCEKHQCVKSKHLQELCAFDQRYFDLWESGEGPMQDVSSNFLKAKVAILDTEEKQDEFFMGDPEIPKISRGFGDTFAKFTKATGLKKATKLLFGLFNADCGCTERQAKWNRLFPYKAGQQETKKTKGFFE